MIHITYASDNMTKAAEVCQKSALKYGCEETFTGWVNHEFYQFNKSILDSERGSGFWLWKPFIIYKALLELVPEDEVLVYSDAGVEFINDLSHIQMDEDVFFFGNNWNHVDWCKADVINAILPNYEIDRPDYQRSLSNKKQIQASVILFRNTQKVRDFVKEWLLYCQMPGFIDDSPSKLPNVGSFQEHRHDQAILTCLQIKYGYKLHYWAASYNDGQFTYDKLPCYTDTYPILFNHHRKRNDQWLQA